jgi:hypothetical protein
MSPHHDRKCGYSAIHAMTGRCRLSKLTAPCHLLRNARGSCSAAPMSITHQKSCLEKCRPNCAGMNLERQTDIAQRESSAVELLGSLNALVVECWVPTTSSGAVEVVQNRRSVKMELIGHHVHGCAAFVTPKKCFQLLTRQSPLRSPRGLRFGPWNPGKLKLEHSSDAFLLVSVV